MNKLDPVLSIGDASIIEGDAGEHEAVFDVTLDDPVPGQTVAVAYRTHGGTAVDEITVLAVAISTSVPARWSSMRE